MQREHHPSSAVAGPQALDGADADRELLAAVRGIVEAVASATGTYLIGQTTRVVQHTLGQVLRAAAVHGLSDELAAAVGERIDRALRSQATVRMAPMSFGLARDHTGRVLVQCAVDLNAFRVGFEGDYAKWTPAPFGEPKMTRVVSLAAELPSAQLVLPPPQFIVHNHARSDTRQVHRRDAEGNLIETVTMAA